MLDEDFKIVVPMLPVQDLDRSQDWCRDLARAELPGKSTARRFEQSGRRQQGKQKKAEAEDVFAASRPLEHENKEELLEKKFKEAFEKADKDDSARHRTRSSTSDNGLLRRQQVPYVPCARSRRSR